jgi:3'-5' exoribonuclease
VLDTKYAIGYLRSVNTSNKKYIYNIDSIRPTKDKLLLSSPNQLSLTIGSLYYFNFREKEGSTSLKPGRYEYISNSNITEALDSEELFEVLEEIGSCPIKILDVKNEILAYVDKIVNANIKLIVNSILNDYGNNFFISIAGTSMHHTYFGGTANHTLSMLKVAKVYTEIYPNLNTDYLYAGIVLHDIAKCVELDSLSRKYTLEGSLLGHLVMGSNLIEKYAQIYKLTEAEEIIILQHILISHHGVPAYGAAKKPATIEALLISIIDSADAKLEGCFEQLHETKEGNFTEQILVLEKNKLYKPKKTQ